MSAERESEARNTGKRARLPVPPEGFRSVARQSERKGGRVRIVLQSNLDLKLDLESMVFVFMLSTFIGIGVIRRVSRLLHTPLMSLTNAISAIAVVGSIIVAGGENHPTYMRVLGAIALFASMTNIISGFLITDRMLKMFKTPGKTQG